MTTKSKVSSAAKAGRTNQRAKQNRSKVNGGKQSAKGKEKAKVDRDAEQFTRDTLARGEAAEADASGNLPPGATHEIVKENTEGLPKIERRRFSLA